MNLSLGSSGRIPILLYDPQPFIGEGVGERLAIFCITDISNKIIPNGRNLPLFSVYMSILLEGVIPIPLKYLL